MRSRFTLFVGIFAIMALSNAIVPVLPAYASTSSWSGAIYSAYFLGAFASTLPAGILSDRYGRVFLMRIGLALTIISGAILVAPATPAISVAARLVEGIGAGLFVPPALSAINRASDHAKMSGYFLALLNAGLVIGLLTGGFLPDFFSVPGAGLFFFTLLALPPFITGIFTAEPRTPPDGHDLMALLALVKEYRWIWYSSIVLVGITGVVSSLYPKFSGAPSETVGLWIAGMSIATIITVLAISRMTVDAILAIRVSAVLMAGGALLAYFSPAGFLILGAVAGIVMIAQIAYLSRIHGRQGIAMGLFSTSSYLGMALLPFLAGLVADGPGFFAAFALTALAALTVLLPRRWG